MKMLKYTHKTKIPATMHPMFRALLQQKKKKQKKRRLSRGTL